MPRDKRPIIVITENDLWRFFGVALVIAGYLFDNKNNIEASFMDFSFKGEALSILGIFLIFVPIFLRGRRS